MKTYTLNTGTENSADRFWHLEITPDSKAKADGLSSPQSRLPPY